MNCSFSGIVSMKPTRLRVHFSAVSMACEYRVSATSPARSQSAQYERSQATFTGMFSARASAQNSGESVARHGSTTTLAAGSSPGKTFSLQVSTTSSPRRAMRRKRSYRSAMVTRVDEKPSQMPRQMPQFVQASPSTDALPSSSKAMAPTGQASTQRSQEAPRARTQ